MICIHAHLFFFIYSFLLVFYIFILFEYTSLTESNYSVSFYYSTSQREVHLKTFLSEDLADRSMVLVI